MKQPNSLTDKGLLEYADEHLQYEVDMLVWSASILAFLASMKGEGYLPWAINNGLLNSYALHARNLINFLYSRSKGTEYGTDVVLEDYLGAAPAPGKLPPISPLLEEALTKANKQVAHLSLERTQYEVAGKAWQFIELSKQILAAFRAIAPLIPDTRLSQAFRDKLSQSKFRIPVVDVTIGKSPSGEPLSVTLTLRIQTDGKSIQGVSA